MAVHSNCGNQKKNPGKNDPYRNQIRHSRQQKFLFEEGLSHHRLSYGGVLRKQRRGRKQRPLSTKEPLHLVFKINRHNLKSQSLRSPKCFAYILKILRQYSAKFMIQVEQVSIQHDHIHLLVRANRRHFFQSFFRVVAGQISFRFEQLGWGSKLWKYRPFTRVVRGWKSYQIVKDYIQLNEKEVTGRIRYQSQRLRGLSSGDWAILWT